MVTSNPLFLFGAGLALFLVGVNTAFLVNLGSELTRWFTFKILSFDLLLIYVCLSLAMGAPATWRAVIAVIALTTDVFALGWMWSSVARLQREGVMGFIPLGRLNGKGDKGDKGDTGLTGPPGPAGPRGVHG
jgi:hypothetical protein